MHQLKHNTSRNEALSMYAAYYEAAGRGRPKYNISEQQIRCLIDLEFKAADIARMFRVSYSTIKRRLRYVVVNLGMIC